MLLKWWDDYTAREFGALLALFGFLVFAARRLLTYLHLFQQEEYDGRRFLAWLIDNRAWDRRLSLALAAIFAVQFVLPGVPAGVFAALVGAASLAIAALEEVAIIYRAVHAQRTSYPTDSEAYRALSHVLDLLHARRGDSGGQPAEAS